MHHFRRFTLLMAKHLLTGEAGNSWKCVSGFNFSRSKMSVLNSSLIFQIASIVWIRFDTAAHRFNFSPTPTGGQLGLGFRLVVRWCWIYMSWRFNYKIRRSLSHPKQSTGSLRTWMEPQFTWFTFPNKQFYPCENLPFTPEAGNKIVKPEIDWFLFETFTGGFV